MKKEVEVEERDHEHDIRHAKETKGNENESKGVQFTAAEIPLKKWIGVANKQSPEIARKFLPLCHRNTRLGGVLRNAIIPYCTLNWVWDACGWKSSKAAPRANSVYAKTFLISWRVTYSYQKRRKKKQKQKRENQEVQTSLGLEAYSHYDKTCLILSCVFSLWMQEVSGLLTV